MAKYISVGVGSSSKKDPLAAAKDAAKTALKECGGKATFSLVYTNALYDQKRILEGINSILGTNWVGSSVDKQINHKGQYDPDIVVSVCCINSDYMAFGVGVSDHYTKDAKAKGVKAIETAMKNVHSNKYVDSYLQFNRAKKQDYTNIVRTPPYFVLAIASSQTKKKGKFVAGNEIDFLEGLIDYTGPHVPVFGMGAGYDFDKFLSPETKEAENYQFANGQVYTDAGIAVFVICNLHFEISVHHGYLPTNNYVAITKLDKTGYEILELNGKEPVEEYCRLVGIKKEDYLKDPSQFSLTRPLGLIALDGSTYIKEAFPNDDGKTLHSTYKLKQNMVMNILKYDEKSLYETMPNVVSEAKKKYPKGTIAMTFFCNCCSRRLLMQGKEAKANEELVKIHKKIPFFGCYAFSEIGSTRTNSAQVHGETVTSLVLFENLLTEF